MTLPNLDLVMDEAMLAAQQGAQPTQEDANKQMEPNPPEDDGLMPDEQVRALQQALYGEEFPPASVEYADLVQSAASDEAAGLLSGASQQALDAMWVSWARSLWASRQSAWQRHLHLVARNRLFRAGFQWVQSRGGAPWASPARPKEALRLVYNMIDKALDQRLQILTDQRPGFMVTPMTGDPDDRRKASARQLACEYQFEQIQMDLKAREAAYWAQTDGVSFWHMFWDDTRGPWDARMAVGTSGPKPLGDLNIRTTRVEQVRVSPEATATINPTWVVIREVISANEAARYGVTGVQALGTDTGHSQMTGENADNVNEWALQQTNVGEGDRLTSTQVTDRITVYVEPHPDVLAGGLHLIIVGDKVVFGPSDLLWKTIPLIRVADGSSDPSYLCRPVMEQWIDHQMRMNVLLSKWQENIRSNAGGKFFGRPNTVGQETFIGGVTSMVEVRGGGALSDNVMPMQGFSIGNDVKEAFAIEKQAFEDASGYNSVSRGQVSGESGRAIIAAREQLERVFAPGVQAMANAFTAWAKVALAGMAWGYSLPRALGATGKSRPDLAREIVGSDLEDEDRSIDVKVEKGTLMPMPLSYRMYLLDSWLQYGVIDAKEYRRRQTFAVAKDVTTPDEDQEARAKRICEALRLSLPEVPELRWTDNEAIHQDVLEREILTQDDLSPQVIQAAQARWEQLSNQQSMKQGALQPPPPPATGSPNGAASSLGLPPGAQPLAASNPSIGAAPMVRMDSLGIPADEQAAQQEDALTPQ